MMFLCRRSRGAALVTAIGVLAILLAIVMTLATLTRLELRIARNTTDAVRARFMAEGGVSIAMAVLRACDPTIASLNQAWRVYFNGQMDGFDNDGDGFIDNDPNNPQPDSSYFVLDPDNVRARLDDANLDNNPALWTELDQYSGVDNDGDGVLDSAWFLVTVPVLDPATGMPRTVDYDGRPTATNGLDDDYDGVIDEFIEFIDGTRMNEVVERVIGRFAILVTDEAGKININAAGNVAGLADDGLPGHNADEGVAPFELDLSALPDINDARARYIVGYRYGDDGAPGWARQDEMPATGTSISLGDDDGNNFFLSQDGVNNDADWFNNRAYDRYQVAQRYLPDVPRPLIDEFGRDFIDYMLLSGEISRNELGAVDLASWVRDLDRWGRGNPTGAEDGPTEYEEGIDEPGEYRPFHPYADDQHFLTVEQMKELAQIGTLRMENLRNLVTVHSYEKQLVFLGQDDETLQEVFGSEARDLQLNLNYADVRTIADAVNRIYFDRFKVRRHPETGDLIGHDMFYELHERGDADNPIHVSIGELLDTDTQLTAQLLEQRLWPVLQPLDEQGLLTGERFRLPFAPQLAANIVDSHDADFAQTETTIDVRYGDSVAEFKFRGVEQIRINEIQARPVYRIEAEDLTMFNGAPTANTASVNLFPQIGPRNAYYGLVFDDRPPDAPNTRMWMYAGWTAPFYPDLGYSEPLPSFFDPISGQSVSDVVEVGSSAVPGSSPARWFQTDGYVDFDPPFGNANDDNGIVGEWTFSRLADGQDDYVALPYAGAYYLMLDLAARDWWGNILPDDVGVPMVTNFDALQYRVEGYTLLPGPDGRLAPVYIDTGPQDIEPTRYRNGYAMVDMYKSTYLYRDLRDELTGTGFNSVIDPVVDPTMTWKMQYDLVANARVEQFYMDPAYWLADPGTFLRVSMRKKNNDSTVCYFNGVVLSGEPDQEWIELANIGDSPVSLGGWQIDVADGQGNMHASATVPAGTIIGPRNSRTLEPGYLLLAVDAADSAGASALRSDFPVDSIYGNGSSFMRVSDLLLPEDPTDPASLLIYPMYPGLMPLDVDSDLVLDGVDNDFDAFRAWICPNHPDVTRPEPGVCPIDGVDLVRDPFAGTDEPYERIVQLEVNYWDSPGWISEAPRPSTMTSFNALWAGGLFPDPLTDGINNDFDDVDGFNGIETTVNEFGINPDADEPDEVRAEVFVRLYQGPSTQGRLVDEVAYDGMKLRGYRPEADPNRDNLWRCPLHPQVSYDEPEVCPIDGQALIRDDDIPNQPRVDYGRALERTFPYDTGDTPNSNRVAVLDGVFDQWDGTHNAAVRSVAAPAWQGRRGATPLANSQRMEISLNLAPPEVYTAGLGAPAKDQFDVRVKNADFSTIGELLDVPYMHTMVDGTTKSAAFELDSPSTVALIDLFTTTVTQLTCEQVWDRGLDENGNFITPVPLDVEKGPNGDQVGHATSVAAGAWQAVTEDPIPEAALLAANATTGSNQYPVVAYRSRATTAPDDLNNPRAEGIWLWDADDGVEDGVYRMYVQMGPPVHNRRDYRVDLAVLTDKTFVLPDGTVEGKGQIDVINPTSIDLVLTMKGVQPRSDGMIEVGMIEVEGQMIALKLINKGDPNIPHFFQRVVLTPRRHDYGRININTVWNSPVPDSVEDSATNEYVTGFFPMVAAVPVFRQFFNGVRLNPVPIDELSPSDFQPNAGTRLSSFIDRIQTARNYELLSRNPLWEDGDLRNATPFRSIGDLLGRRVLINATQMRILSDITDAQAVANPEMAFRQRREIVERFKRLSNLVTTRSDVFEIIVTAQAGQVPDEPKRAIQGVPGERVPGVYGFQLFTERKLRVVYER